MNDQELLPCPFCGHSAQVTKGDPNSGFFDRVEVECSACRISTFWLHEDVARRMWNTRVPHPPAAQGAVSEDLLAAVDTVKDIVESDRTYDAKEVTAFDKWHVRYMGFKPYSPFNSIELRAAKKAWMARAILVAAPSARQDAAAVSGELAPCPHCGSAVKLSYIGSSDWNVECQSGASVCGAETTFWVRVRDSDGNVVTGDPERDEAIRRWNLRALKDATTAEQGARDVKLGGPHDLGPKDEVAPSGDLASLSTTPPLPGLMALPEPFMALLSKTVHDAWAYQMHTYARQHIAAMQAKLDEYKRDAERYAEVRTWHARKFTNVWELNIAGKGAFDDLVDASLTAAKEKK